MGIFEDVIAGRTEESDAFGDGDPMDVFHGLGVFVEFTVRSSKRHPFTEQVPGHPGTWICVYSSLDRLIDRRGDVEYSLMRGGELLACLPDDAGLWYDRGHPGGRKILLPPVRIEPML